jgi:hypothetical protein
MKKTLLILIVLVSFSCSKRTESTKFQTFTDQEVPGIGLSESGLYDKVLGMLVGSAMGDAMGAPTEMWSREGIELEYGFVEGLDSMIRETSPEGIWKANLPAGGTTDDTRWKKLGVEFLLTQKGDQLNPKQFASHILSEYKKSLSQFEKLKGTDAEPYEKALMQANWLSEWAKVSEPLTEGNIQGYSDSLSKFYGGEMVCAGLLYAPALGVFFPGDPEKAYQETYRLTLFDLGYARDLSALAGAMTAAGMKPNATKKDLLAALRLDPEGFFQSRLVGRTAYKILRESLSISQEAHRLDSLPGAIKKGSPALAFAYAELDRRQQDMPFHAGEIYLQALTAMIYSDFDFKNTLIFLTNYGRDNDTTAALAGGILGAWYGFDKLPEVERNKVLKVNKEILGIDLKELAMKLTRHIMKERIG